MLDIRHGLHVLTGEDLAAFLGLVDQDPVVNVFAGYRARTTNLDPRWLGGEVWGCFEDGRLRAACHVGANLVPVQADRAASAAFAERAVRRGRTASTVVGPHASVRAFWDAVDGAWGEPRELRWHQPHLEIAADPSVRPDPLVRASEKSDMDALYPACVAMYSEEVGVSPEVGGGADLYRARVQQLVARGWSFARYDDDQLVFKAEVAWATPRAAQVQGVYVPPDLRGRGLAAAGMAAVVELVRSRIAPTVSLYVNEWNVPALRAYERVGFAETARFATIMF